MSNVQQELILIVDDHESSRYARARVLRRTGLDALRLVASAKPSLVLLDVQLPDVNGLEVCRQIKAEPTLAVIPVLHMSATNVTTPDQVRGLEGGADGYLVEPVAPEVLVATVGALLRMRRAESGAREVRRALDVLIGNLPGAAYSCSKIGGRLMFVSNRVLELTGLTVPEALAGPHGWWDLMPPEDRAAARERIASSKPGDSLEFTYRISHRNGGVRWIWDRVAPVVRDSGECYWEGFATDMTERMASGVPQADGSIRPEPRMQLSAVTDALLTMARMPLDANVLFLTVMATKMPFVGRG